MSDALKAREALARLRENLASFDAEVAYELASGGERADLWGEIDVNVEDLRAALSALVPDEVAGVEPVAWVNERAIDDLEKGGEQTGFAGVQTILWANENTAGKRHGKRVPLYSASTLTALAARAEKAEREREEAQRRLAAWDINSLPRDMSLLDIVDARIDDLRKFMDRAETAEARITTLESENTALRARLEEAGRVIEPFAGLALPQQCRAFMQLLVCPDGDTVKGDYAPSIRAARRFLEEAK